jgi:hypothetical protein
MSTGIDLARIAEAAQVVDPVFRDSPQFMSGQLSGVLGRNVLVKRWNGLSWPILAGLAATTISRLLKVPSLGAVIIGMFVTAGFRFIA